MEHLGHVLKGYLECAKWADCPEESPNARFCKSAIESAREDCAEFLAACGPLYFQAINCDGYSAEQFGHDFWLTRNGHGAGFWDREALGGKAVQNLFATDRNGKTYTVNGRGYSLGDYLSAIAYGDSAHISKFAYPSLTAYRGWLYFMDKTLMPDSFEIVEK